MIQHTSQPMPAAQPMSGTHHKKNEASHRIPATRPTLYPKSSSAGQPREAYSALTESRTLTTV